MLDVIIIGAGPAGLTAALYACRAGKKTLVIERSSFGGQIVWSPKVENYPALPSVSGLELGDNLTKQAQDAGATLELDEVTAVKKTEDGFRVSTVFGGDFEGRTVIFATGASPRRLGIADEEKYIGAGISFCAVCDGEFYRGKTVGVVGGGNTAMQEALYLSDICETVHLIHRRDEFRADAILETSLSRRSNVVFHKSATVSHLTG
ncbi:MAG: NAD(P)/FAD-dependent oxidoreductase, partial [Eubacteriales bacterium]